MERSRYHGDEIGVGKAYEALARCHERYHIWKVMILVILYICSKGDLENAVKCLELYVEVAERSGASEPVANACSAAGIMFNSLVCGLSSLSHFIYLFFIPSIHL